MHTTKFAWMLDRLAPVSPGPSVATTHRPMRERCVVARNRHGYTITTRHYTDGDVALRHAECAAAGLEVVDDDHALHLQQP